MKYHTNIKLNVESIASFEQLIFNLLSDHKNLFEYIFVEDLVEEVSHSGVCSNGLLMTQTLTIPNELAKPKKFNYNDYPLNDNKTYFTSDHGYDYLTTREVGSMINADDKDIRYSELMDLLKTLQCQSRMANCWRQLASMMIANTFKFGPESVFLKLVRASLRKLCPNLNYSEREFPFFESHNKFTFYDLTICTILPTLVYSITFIGFHLMLDTITEVEAVLLFNHYFWMAKDSFQDMKLKIKGVSRSWYLEALHNIGKTMMPVWSISKEIVGFREKRTYEIGMTLDQIKSDKADRKKLLSPYLLSYIEEKCLKSKTQTQIAKMYAACRVASNDGTYYKTLTELSLDKAIQATVRESVVQKPSYIKLNSFGVHEQRYYEGLPARVSDFLQLFVNKTAELVNDQNIDAEFVVFLTMSSSGTRVTEHEKKRLGETLSKLMKKRLVRAAEESDQYRDLEFFIKRYGDAIIIVQRQQIDRRQRGIAGINNQKLLASFGGYIIAKEFFKLTETAAQGKQTGNINDISNMLYWTSTVNSLFSSMDVKGMDASIQSSLREVVNGFNLKVANLAKNQLVGPFIGGYEYLHDVESKRMDKVQTYVSGLTKLISFEVSNAQTSVTYVSKMFKNITNNEGTFSSGRADTSAHHTMLLPAIIRAVELDYDNSAVNLRCVLSAMGDDLIQVCNGNEAMCVKNLEDNAKAMNELGFSVEAEASRNSMVFLQQHCVNGCFWGYGDRIGPFAKEHNNESVSKLQKVQELRALVDDLTWRVTDVRGLRYAAFFIACLCAGKFTLSISKLSYEPLCKLLDTKFKIIKHTDNPDYSSRLVTIFVPLMWFFMQKGGELPCFPVERSDGSYTCEESIHTPKGDYKRYLLFDISNVKELIKAGSSKVEFDLPHFEALRINDAFRLLEMRLVENEFSIKRRDFDTIYLATMARKLEGIVGGFAFSSSREAAAQLRTLYNINLSNDIVYGEQLTERVLQTAETLQMSEAQRRIFSNEMVISLYEVISKVPRYKKSDVVHLYYIDELEATPGNIIGTNNIEFVSHDILLSYNLNANSESTMALAYLGMYDDFSNSLMSELNATRGRYGQFKFDQPVFTQGFSIWRNNRGALDLFFKAINADMARQQLFIKAFEYYSIFSKFQYLYSLSPRNVFMININLERLQNIMSHDSQLFSNISFIRTIFMLHVLRNCFELRGARLNIQLHDKLRDHLFQGSS